MTDQELATGKALSNQIKAITDAQALLAAAGAKAAVSALDAEGKTTITPDGLKAALGDDYTTLIAGVLTDLNAALATAKTAAQSAFTALGAA